MTNRPVLKAAFKFAMKAFLRYRRTLPLRRIRRFEAERRFRFSDCFPPLARLYRTIFVRVRLRRTRRFAGALRFDVDRRRFGAARLVRRFAAVRLVVRRFAVDRRLVVFLRFVPLAFNVRLRDLFRRTFVRRPVGVVTGAFAVPLKESPRFRGTFRRAYALALDLDFPLRTADMYAARRRPARRCFALFVLVDLFATKALPSFLMRLAALVRPFLIEAADFFPEREMALAGIFRRDPEEVRYIQLSC